RQRDLVVAGRDEEALTLSVRVERVVENRASFGRIMFAVGSSEIEPYWRRLALLIERSDSNTGGGLSEFQPCDGHLRLFAAASGPQEEIEVPKLIGDVSDRLLIGRHGGRKLVARRVSEGHWIAPGPEDAIEITITLAVNDDRGVDRPRSVRKGRDGLELGYVS